MKKPLICALVAAIAATGTITIVATKDDRPVLKVANWAEYIDMGDDEEGTKPLYEEFEKWYKKKTGKEIRVEYCIADDNETLYNMIKMGDHFDLICPSEYMIMKLAAEGRLQKLPESFYDTDNPDNYYAKYVSPYISSVFENNYIKDDPWSEYAAGYMWGTTGFVYNPELVNEADMTSWNVFTNPAYKKKTTAKNNIRDTYFVGLAMYYEEQLKALKSQYTGGTLSFAEYQTELSRLMNDTDEKTMSGVKKVLKSITDNLYGFETDEGKNDMIAGKITVNYQWSGDAVYIMDVAEGFYEEEEVENPVKLNYAIPDTVSNLWFDGWVIPKDCENVEAATAFINFLSMPENAVRNMNYIGYTSCIAGETVFEDYVLDCYEANEDETDIIEYDLSYYFGEGYALTAPAEQAYRQLFAQYPTEETLARCVAMQYFDRDANTRANLMWSDITFF
ncbi:MAG: extracellular solute-binding protein [Clostridia bacterium]|nr:extracellular solute-binding protein [Clostridia bacterium]